MNEKVKHFILSYFRTLEDKSISELGKYNLTKAVAEAIEAELQDIKSKGLNSVQSEAMQINRPY